jgi:hypothetical protein
MRTTGVVVVVAVVVGCSGCFSTARYDDAHVKRVESIEARYEAERVREQERQTALIAALAGYHALLIPIRPGSLSAPVSRVDERDDIVQCRKQCERRAFDKSPERRRPDAKVNAQCLRDTCEPAYVDALARTYVAADVHWVTLERAASEGADLEVLMAFSHNQAIRRRIDDETRNLAQLLAQMRERPERDRRAEIAASARRRDAEITSGRVAHRARLQAAASAFTAMDRSTDPRPQSLCAAGDPGLRRAAGCRSALPLPDPGSSVSAQVSSDQPSGQPSGQP